MFGSKSRLIKKQQKEISELKRRLYVTMSNDCRHNNHDFYIRNEYTLSAYSQPSIDVWTERILECKNCGKTVKDDDRICGFQYKIGDE